MSVFYYSSGPIKRIILKKNRKLINTTVEAGLVFQYGTPKWSRFFTIILEPKWNKNNVLFHCGRFAGVLWGTYAGVLCVRSTVATNPGFGALGKNFVRSGDMCLNAA